MEQRSFQGAAKIVNLSQPALSKSIHALEDEYGVKLFDRHPRGLMPTVFGHALEYHAKRILLDIEQSKNDISAIASGAAGRIRVGVGQALFEYVEDALVELESTFPNVDNTVITDYAEGLRLALLENRVDFVLGMVNSLVGEEEFETNIVASDPIVGLCSPSHKFAGQEVSIVQLRGTEWVVPARGEVARSALEAFFLLNHEPQPRFKVVTNLPTLLSRFVRDSHLLSLTPQGSYGDYEGFGLAWFKIKDFNFERKIGVVRRAGIAPNPLQIAFSDILVKNLEAAFRKPKSP